MHVPVLTKKTIQFTQSINVTAFNPSTNKNAVLITERVAKILNAIFAPFFCLEIHPSTSLQALTTS